MPLVRFLQIETKRAAVDPLARVSAAGTPERGDEIHSPLVRNPYTGTDGAVDYENGYEHAQRLGHAAIGAMTPVETLRWKHAPAAWQAGFVAASKALGVGTALNTLQPSSPTPGKLAMHLPLTEYFALKTAMPIVAPGRTSVPGALGAAAFGAGAGLLGNQLANRWAGPTPSPTYEPNPLAELASGDRAPHFGESVPMQALRPGNHMFDSGVHTQVDAPPYHPGLHIPHVSEEIMGQGVPGMQIPSFHDLLAQ